MRCSAGFSPLSLQEAIQLDGQILFSLLHKVSPVAYKHLSKQKIDPILYMTEWFMCAFSRTLPWSSVLRVWDMFFCEGRSSPPLSSLSRAPLAAAPVARGRRGAVAACLGRGLVSAAVRGAVRPKSSLVRVLAAGGATTKVGVLSAPEGRSGSATLSCLALPASPLPSQG